MNNVDPHDGRSFLRKLVARATFSALVTFSALSVITVVGWIVVFYSVVHNHVKLESMGLSILTIAMFVMGLGLNLFIYYVMSMANAERNEAKRVELVAQQDFHSQLEEMKVSRERLELAIRGANVGLWDRNEELGTFYLSPQWKAMLGYRDEEFPSSNDEWMKRVHPDDVALATRNDNPHIDGTHHHFQNEYRLRHKDGNYLWVSDRGLIIADSMGNVCRSIGVTSDVTEQKRIEKIKGEFISTVSYELRTPLTSIAASLGLLEAGVFGDLPSKALGLVSIASKNSKRLTILVNDILDMERLHSGKTALRADEIDLIELVKQSMELNFEAANAQGINVTLTSPSGCRNVIGDKERLVQVMGNLLSNATKFSTYGGDVEIQIIQQEKFAKVLVRDHGIGIPDEFRSRIFSEFAQADLNEARQHGGTGLGLNITKKLIERMGGKIGYESALGEGSTFWFVLPSSLTWNFAQVD